MWSLEMLSYLLLLVSAIQLVRGQPCAYTAKYTNIVAKDLDMATTIKRHLVTIVTNGEKQCPTYCTNDLECEAYSYSTNEALIANSGYCYIYTGLVDANIDRTGNDTLHIKGCRKPIACVYGEWTDWSECGVTCGGGTQVRIRSKTDPQHGGAVCNDTLTTETQPCVTGIECSVCKWSWTAWSACYDSAGNTIGCGKGHRSRGMELEVTGHGSCHNFSIKTEVQNCSKDTPCPVHCSYNDWSDWSTCSVTCGGSGTKQQRTRTINTHGANGGLPCNQTVLETQLCGTHSCTKDCVWKWSNWSDCSTSCGPGTQGRHVIVVHNETNGGAPCNFTSEGDFRQCPEDRPECPCRYKPTITEVDPQSRASSAGFDIIPDAEKCSDDCAVYTKANGRDFDCKAYTWAGPGEYCYLHGPVDLAILLFNGSKFDFYEWQCGNELAPHIKCQWKETKTGIKPAGTAAYAGRVGFNGCIVSCRMNRGGVMCTAFAVDDNDDCYLFQQLDKTALGSGSFKLFEIVCPSA